VETLNCLTEECITLLHKNKLLDPLIKSSLINSTLSQVNLSPEKKATLINYFLEKNQVDSEKIDEWLKENNLEKDDMENLALGDERLEIYCKEQFNNKLDSYFLERKDQLDIVVYSLLRVKDFFQANEYYLRIIESEADFGELASKYSEGLEKKSRGIVGPVPLGQTHPRLAELLINSPQGETQPPIEIGGSYIVVRVESYDPAKLDDYMRKNLRKELFYRWIDTQTSQFISKLLKEGVSFLNKEDKV